MVYMQNKYKDYTSIIQNGYQIYFFNGVDSLSNYDARQKIFDQRLMRFPLDMNFKTLAPHMYFKEVKDDEKNNMMGGKDNGVLDSILIMSYNSYDTIQDPIDKKSK